MSSENLLVSETVTVPTMPSGEAPTMVDVMSAISQMGNRFSTAIEAMSTRITQLEDSESQPLTSSNPNTPQRGDEGESDRPSLWVDRSMSETFQDYPLTGLELIDDKL